MRSAILLRRVARAVTPIALVVYALGLLWPLEFRLPSRLVNHPVWTEAGTLRFDGPGLALSSAPPRWQEASRKLGYFHVFLLARSFSPNQQGPARLFTLARDTFVQNLMIGQLGNDLVVRLRGLCRGIRLHGRMCPKQLRIPAVFATREWVEIDLRIKPTRVTLRAGDRPPLEQPLADDPLRGWDPENRLALGNDVTGLRPWLGELAHVTIDTPSGQENGLDPSNLEIPTAFWLLDRQPNLTPFYHVSRKDGIINILLYIPMAILIAISFQYYGALQILLTIASILVISTSFEVGQLFVKTRNFSLTDIMLNLAGGAGASLAVYMFVKNTHRN